MNNLKRSLIGFLFLLVSLGACVSKTPYDAKVTEKEPLSPHEICLLKEQNKKKAIYDSLPDLLKRISGDSQIVAESSNKSLPLGPTKKDLDRAISLVVETKDVSMWGTEKEGHAYTVSGYVVHPSEWTDLKLKENIAFFHFSVGQPGRPYQIPLTAIRAEGDGLVANVDETYVYTPSVGLPSERKPSRVKIKAQIKIREIDSRHVLILFRDQSPGNLKLNFTSKYSLLVRTYPPQNFNTEDRWQEWPVYGVGEPNSPCDGIK